MAFFFWLAWAVVNQRDGLERSQHGFIRRPTQVRFLLPLVMADELDNAIRDNASGPAKATGDGTSIEQHMLADQIAADKYLANKRAGRNPAKALTRVKIVPPGAV